MSEEKQEEFKGEVPSGDEPREEVDWRKGFAGDDEKFLSHLSRYNTQKDAVKAGFELKQKISSGEYKRNIEAPKDNPEQLKEWRAENGIPDSFDKYSVPKGIIVGDADKPVIDEFFKSMHEKNIPDSFVTPVIDWYYKTEERKLAAEAEQNSLMKKNTEDELRTEWGNEYRSIMSMATNHAKAMFGDELADALMSMPDSAKVIADWAREKTPGITVARNTSNPEQSITDELAELRVKMQDVDKFRKDAPAQKRYKELILEQEKFKK